MNLDNEQFSRLRSIYTDQQMEKLFNTHVLVAGLGGVGSFCATTLARSGVGKLTLIDFDIIEESNINRQEFATHKTIGQKKVDVAKQIIFDINPNINLETFDEKIIEHNVSKICQDTDFIIDVIDDVPAKIALVKFAQENSISILSCMGTALRKDPTKLKFADIYDTSVCPLCKSFRKRAKDAKIDKLEVLYSTELALKPLTDDLGSTSYVPPIAGMMLAWKAIDTITCRKYINE